MRRALADIVLRLAVLVALGVSTALLWDYFRPMPAFCDVGSGCDRVRASRYSSLLGVPVPLLGCAGFVALFALSLFDDGRARRATRLLAIAAGVVGLTLLVVQASVLGVFCRLCVAVDLSAAVAAFAALLRDAGRAHEGAFVAPPATKSLWIAGAVAVVAVPGLWSWVQPSPPVPAEIARLWQPGTVNVVEFADFQCPFCRELHPAMRELLQEYEGRVHFVRLNMPLASHSHARDAARAYVCAERAGRGPEMADALFAADSLTPEGCVNAGAMVGLDPTQLRGCMARPETDARIDDDMRQVKAAGLAGLPTVWIGDQVFVGTRPKEELRQAFEVASRGSHKRLPLAWLWAALGAALLAVAGLAWRAQRRAPTALRRG